MGIINDVIWMLGAILIGLWLADFASGIFHWAVDNYCDPTWPLIGKTYILPSHLHHEEEMYEFNIFSLETHLHIWAATLIVGSAFWIAGLMNLVIASACLFGCLTNIIHHWSHAEPDQNIWFIRILQRIGLFQSIEHHTHHHGGNSDSHYCLLTDHINPPLEFIALWARLDRIALSLGIEKNWWEKAKLA